VSFAQQFPFSPRENAIFTALNQLQAREEAIRDSIKDAQMKLIENRVVETKANVVFFKNLASRTHPYLDLETQFDDNVDARAGLKKSSLINSSKLGLNMNFSGTGKFVNVDMHIDNVSYNNRPRSNNLESEIALTNNFILGRYNLSIYEDYFNNYIAKPHFGIKKDQFSYYWANTFGYTLGTHFNRLNFDIGYKRVDYDYEPDYSSSDKINETYSFHQYLLIATKTQLSLEYIRFQEKYKHPFDSPADYNYNNFTLGLTGVLSSKLTGSANIGYKISDYKIGIDHRDLSLEGTVGYKVFERTDLALALNHLIHHETNVADYYIENSFEIGSNHRLAFNPKFNLSLGYKIDCKEYNKKTDLDPGSRIDTFSFGLSYAFRRWLDFSLTYNYSKTNYKDVVGYDINTITFATQAKF
jgi:hypothetical protein